MLQSMITWISQENIHKKAITKKQQVKEQVNELKYHIRSITVPKMMCVCWWSPKKVDPKTIESSEEVSSALSRGQ